MADRKRFYGLISKIKADRAKADKRRQREAKRRGVDNEKRVAEIIPQIQAALLASHSWNVEFKQEIEEYRTFSSPYMQHAGGAKHIHISL